MINVLINNSLSFHYEIIESIIVKYYNIINIKSTNNISFYLLFKRSSSKKAQFKVESFNEYITERLRSANSSYEQIKQFSSEVNILENDLLPEGSDLSTFIGKFFSTLQEIGAAPEDSAPRTVAMEAGKDLSNAFNRAETVCSG